MADIPMSATAAQAKKVWVEALYVDTIQESFFGSRFMSSGFDNVIHEDTKLTSQKGGSIEIGVRARLGKGFLPAGAKVDGNEARITTFMDSVPIEEWKFGTTADDTLSEQRAFYNMSEESRAALIEEAALNMDQKFFDALDATNTQSVYMASGVVTATSTLATAVSGVTANDKITPEFLTQLGALAETGFNDRRYPLLPLNIEGQSYFIFLTHQDALTDLLNDSTFLAGQRVAMERGRTNPLFRGALTIWRNIIVFAHINVAIAATGGAGSDVSYVKSHLLGRNALALAWAKRPIVEPKKVAYDNEEQAWGWFAVAGVKKTQFAKEAAPSTKLDYGAITVVTARTGLSDITIS